jgi:hypothetical protein
MSSKRLRVTAVQEVLLLDVRFPRLVLALTGLSIQATRYVLMIAHVHRSRYMASYVFGLTTVGGFVPGTDFTLYMKDKHVHILQTAVCQPGMPTSTVLRVVVLLP